MLVSSRHDHQNVDIAVLVRRAIGMGTEQDDLVRAKLLGNLAREGTDQAERNVRTEIEFLGIVGNCSCSHISILRHGRKRIQSVGKLVVGQFEFRAGPSGLRCHRRV